MRKIDFVFFEGSYVDFLSVNKKEFTHVINYIDIASSLYDEDELILKDTFSEVLINLNIFKRIKRIVNYKLNYKKILYYTNPNKSENIKENIKKLLTELLEEDTELNIYIYDK